MKQREAAFSLRCTATFKAAAVAVDVRTQDRGSGIGGFSKWLWVSGVDKKDQRLIDYSARANDQQIVTNFRRVETVDFEFRLGVNFPFDYK